MAAAHLLTKITGGDQVLNRVQDQLLNDVNPALARVAALSTPVAVTGSRGGNAALASLLSALAKLGLITDQTT